MARTRHFSLSLVLINSFYISLILTQTSAQLSFCFRGRHELTSKLESGEQFHPEDAAECPGGVLFNRPFMLKALASQNETFCVKRSVCDESWECGNQKQSIMAQAIKLGKPKEDDSWEVFENDDSIIENIPECKPTKASSSSSSSEEDLHEHHDNHHLSKRAVNGLVPSVRTSNDEIQTEVDDQTKRMFYYLTGINQDQVNSHLRVVKLYKMSTQLVSMICEPTFINPKFLQEIERGFLFLLKEQGFDKLVDIDLESYNQLKLFLEHCATNVTMVKFGGKTCPTGTSIHKVYTFDGPQAAIKSIPYAPDEKTFKWGEYDVVLDAAWSVMNIVHSGCFEFFSKNVNLHHKFEVALEQLFHAALYLRWEHPTQLADDSFYDSIFMTKVNDTMMAMDGCTRFLYLLTPFKVQLNRPIHETFYRRKKRSTSSEEEERELIGQMFSSQENSMETSQEAYGKNEHIPGNSPEDSKTIVEVASCLQSQQEMDAEVKQMRNDYQC